MSDLLTRIDRPGNPRFDVPQGRWIQQNTWLILEVETDDRWYCRGAINCIREDLYNVFRGTFDDIKSDYGWRIGSYVRLEDAKRALLRYVECSDPEAA